MKALFVLTLLSAAPYTTAVCGPALGDFDGDGDVDARDLGAFAAGWREAHRPGGVNDPTYDLAGEGRPGPRAAQVLTELYLAGLAPLPPDMFAGAFRYPGPAPLVSTVTYDSGGLPVTVEAFRRQVQVVLQRPVDVAVAAGLFADHGGAIVAQIPHLGYYLVETAPAGEASFIAAVRASPLVYLAAPHFATRYAAVGVTVVDDCSGDHGTRVQKVITDHGVPVEQCRSDGSGSPISTWTLYEVEREINENKTAPSLINVSSYYGLTGGADWETQPDDVKRSALRGYTDNLKAILKTISQMPLFYRTNVAITLCAGNNHMPLDDVLAELADDPAILDVLRNNVLIVGSWGQSFSNYALPFEDDFAWTNNPEAADGTSFAAPYALAIISKIMTQRGVSATEALRIVKQAVALNPSHELVEAEVLGPTEATYTGPFTGSTTDSVGGSVWKADVSLNLSVTVSGAGVLADPYEVIMYFDGTVIETLVHCDDPDGCDPGRTYPIAGVEHNSCLGKIIGSATSPVGAGSITVSLNDGVVSGNALNGSITVASEAFDAPIVKPVALNRKP